jgi:DNA-binding beta-propeller fold protein YncE
VAKITAGLRSNGIAVQPGGKRVFVSNGGDSTVSVIDAA